MKQYSKSSIHILNSTQYQFEKSSTYLSAGVAVGKSSVTRTMNEYIFLSVKLKYKAFWIWVWCENFSTFSVSFSMSLFIQLNLGLLYVVNVIPFMFFAKCVHSSIWSSKIPLYKFFFFFFDKIIFLILLKLKVFPFVSKSFRYSQDFSQKCKCFSKFLL